MLAPDQHTTNVVVVMVRVVVVVGVVILVARSLAIKSTNPEARMYCNQIPSLPFTNCVSLGKLLNISHSVSHLKNRDDSSAYFKG